jgi:hypothetical protein
VNTLVHEFVHNVDFFGDGSAAVEMGHGDQSPAGKDDSAPWWIGALAARYYAAEHHNLVGEPEDDEPFVEEFTIDASQTVDSD